MRILHTSDWHLGRSLYGRKRYDEFESFLKWLSKTIIDQSIDVLLVAGDVFDNSTPSNRAQELYYRFLSQISNSDCRHVVVVGGNHDSPSFLNAPKNLLQVLNVHVIGSITESLDDEILVLRGDELPKAIICAVPYLRDKDIRNVEPGETIDDKSTKLFEGIRNHYKEICDIAELKQVELEKAGHGHIPIIAMGHLFTTGGKTLDGDGVRELYVGSLTRVGEDSFPSSIDYLALGHLHVSQSVGDTDHIRYSGSPIPMGFGEATQTKKVVVVEFSNCEPVIQEINVPCFQQLVCVVGNLDEIYAKIIDLKKEQSKAWIEVEYTGADIIGDLRAVIAEALIDSTLEVRCIKNKKANDRIIGTIVDNETLDNLDISDVFLRCLDAYDIPDENRVELTVSYNEIIKSLHEEDANAE